MVDSATQQVLNLLRFEEKLYFREHKPLFHIQLGNCVSIRREANFQQQKTIFAKIGKYLDLLIHYDVL